MTVSVCICTFRRPEGLRRLLEGLARQSDAPPFNLVVVDNDPDHSARPVVESFGDRLAIRYIRDATRSLATIRNRAVRESDGECLAFVDDDVEVPETWLGAHHRALVELRADATAGATRFAFDDPVPEAIRSCRIFRRANHPAGHALPWFLASTGNACIRRRALPHATDPFPQHYGSTGGEDIACFRALVEAGGRLLAAGPGACVTEHREQARARHGWVLRRALRNGGNMVDLEWARAGRGHRLLLAARAMGRSVRDGAAALRARRGNPLRYVEKSIDAAEQFGRFLCVLGYRYPEYKSPR